MSVSDTLNKAADYLQVNGWKQGDLGDEGGPRCLMGAINSALGNPHISDFEELTQAAQRVKEYVLDVPANWNDRPGRTATEVVEVLRATALIEAARQRETAEVTR